MKTFFEKVIEKLKDLDEVELIMLGGSRAVSKNDQLSDYDVYVYSNRKIDIEKRKIILEESLKYYEIENKFWEEEDDGILKDGKEIEIIYRNINFIDSQFNYTFKEYKASIGYSTCMIHNVLTSKVIYDKNNIIEEYRKKYNYYPNELKKNIILQNIKLIDDKMPSLSYQIKKAIKRNDIISINHRIAEYLAIYFDILFAINERFHPGEKRLLEYLDELDIEPINAKENIKRLLESGNENSKEKIEKIDELSIELNKLVKDMYPEYLKSKYSNIKYNLE
ncbi:DUF4037 domain-containing protein [uncultured Clostridium sp.]|uniref:DUF4037 domain-containing protein n=1 Tax=uncultured Clostridium sp. TaxID=59620 RepID=UPI002608E8C3|nr:DUF4037 domain-containing protein [uncultured Clostridium sp.]